MSALLNVPDIARLLNCSECTVRAELASGELPGLKIGKEWLAPADAFYQRLNERALREAETRRRGGTGRQPTAIAVTDRPARRMPPALPDLIQS